MLRSQVQIPGQDYNIDRSDLEITCRYSNSMAPGGGFVAYNINLMDKPLNSSGYKPQIRARPRATKQGCTKCGGTSLC